VRVTCMGRGGWPSSPHYPCMLAAIPGRAGGRQRLRQLNCPVSFERVLLWCAAGVPPPPAGVSALTPPPVRRCSVDLGSQQTAIGYFQQSLALHTDVGTLVNYGLALEVRACFFARVNWSRLRSGDGTLSLSAALSEVHKVWSMEAVAARRR
jgi:hypothetical protein